MAIHIFHIFYMYYYWLQMVQLYGQGISSSSGILNDNDNSQIYMMYNYRYRQNIIDMVIDIVSRYLYQILECYLVFQLCLYMGYSMQGRLVSMYLFININNIYQMYYYYYYMIYMYNNMYNYNISHMATHIYYMIYYFN